LAIADEEHLLQCGCQAGEVGTQAVRAEVERRRRSGQQARLVSAQEYAQQRVDRGVDAGDAVFGAVLPDRGAIGRAAGAATAAMVSLAGGHELQQLPGADGKFSEKHRRLSRRGVTTASGRAVGHAGQLGVGTAGHCGGCSRCTTGHDQRYSNERPIERVHA